MSSKSFDSNPFESSSSKSMRCWIHSSVTKGLSSDPDYQMVKNNKRPSAKCVPNNDFEALRREHFRKSDELRAYEQYDQLKSKLVEQDSSTAYEVLRTNLANMRISKDLVASKKLLGNSHTM